MTRFRHGRSHPSEVPYEVSSGGAAAEGASAAATPLAAPAPARTPHLPITHSMEAEGYMPSHSAAQTATHTQAMSVHSSGSRKRKVSSVGNSSTLDDDDGDHSRSSRMTPDKKQNHSEIEKRRRDKMNTYIAELSSMIPMCGAMARKLDKLTVLRMAVQHLRSVRGALSACPLAARPRPAVLPEPQLNALLLQAARDAFLLVVGCDRGRLLYASASVANTLHYEQSELLGQSFFDILHPKDMAKVKEQLSASDLSPRERLIDIKTMLPVKTDMASAGASRFCPGARRSFCCRIKCKPSKPSSHQIAGQTAGQVAGQAATQVKEEGEAKRKKHSNEKRYCVVQFTGYLKSFTPAEMADGQSQSCNAENPEDDAISISCLVAVGRALPATPPAATESSVPVRPMQYVSRHANDGKFLFVDQRVTIALGFLPQELYGTSMYEYVSGPSLGAVARAHKEALLTRSALHTPPYAFRRKDGGTLHLQTHFKPLRNPWTKDVECLVANNTVITDEAMLQQEQAQTSYDIYKQQADVEMQRLIDSQVESQKIGSAIAEEVLRRSSTDFSPELPPEILQDAVFIESPSLVDNILGADMTQVRNNVPLSSVGGTSPHGEPMGGAGSPRGDESPPLPLAIDGNGEAAMAVIMSLLEADAGLGGPVNFSGLPWPLP